MNLLPATFATRNGKPTATTADLTADLSAYPFAQKPSEGAPIMLGLRPEHFHLDTTPLTDAALTTTLPVTHVERTGSDAIVSLAVTQGRIDARIDPEAAARLKTGDRLHLEFPGHKISIFNAATGLRL